MGVQDILDILSIPGPDEAVQTRNLREKARATISEIDTSADSDTTTTTTSLLSSTLLDLLTQVVRPLFTRSQHPSLTSTGRKNQLPPQPSPFGTRFTGPVTDDDEHYLKPWKTTPFTVPLLTYTLTTYQTLPADLQKSTIEAHFHLLIPPILNMIDDADATYKAHGCRLLYRLCTILISTKSSMLERTGLADVFIDALKAHFMLLPTLTPEDESLLVLTELYPAFLSVVDARYPRTDGHDSSSISDSAPNQPPPFPNRAAKPYIERQTQLKLVLRQGILASLTHLSSGPSFTNSVSVRITTFLVRQIDPVVNRMGIESVRYLREILPMMRLGLMDPFALVAPELVLGVIDVLSVVVGVCSERVAQKWWVEILRGVVACWLNCVDEAESAKRDSLGEVQRRLKRVVKALSNVVDEKEWKEAVQKLVQQEKDLQALFAE